MTLDEVKPDFTEKLLLTTENHNQETETIWIASITGLGNEVWAECEQPKLC